MKFLAHLQEMADADVRALIPGDTLSRIKETDSTPVFRVYVVGHEGESEGNIVGVGKVVKRWFESAIHKIVEKLQFGTKVFHSHADDNRHEERSQIGEVVAKATQYIQGKLSALAVMYIYPKFRNLPLDVASIEADIRLDPASGESIHAVDVKKITGIAVGNSAVQKPGFAGAELVGEIQAFVTRSHQFNQGGGKMTIDEVKQFIKADNVKPSDVFTLAQLTDDPSVVGFVEAENKIAVSGEYANRKRDGEGFDKTRKKLETENKTLTDEIAKLKLENAKTQVGGLFEKVKKDRDLSEKQIKFIEPKLKEFTPEKIEDMAKELDSHVDDLIDEFKVISKDVFGEEVEEKKTEENKKGGGEPHEKKVVAKEDRAINPETNPMIPTD